MTRTKYKNADDKIAEKRTSSLEENIRKKKLERLYVKELKSIREIAELLDCSKDMVYRALKGYGIELRNNVKSLDLPPIKVPLFELDFLPQKPLGQVAYTPKSYEVYTHYIPYARSQ